MKKFRFALFGRENFEPKKVDQKVDTVLVGQKRMREDLTKEIFNPETSLNSVSKKAKLN